jgi:hypothetical protein
MSTAVLPAKKDAPSTVADAIEQTLEWLDQQSGDITHDRRNSQRGRYRTTARIAYVSPGDEHPRTFEVSTRNLSRTGLSFIHRTFIYPKQQLEIHLPLPDHSVRHLRGKVIRIRPAGVGLYEIGVEFTELELTIA